MDGSTLQYIWLVTFEILSCFLLQDCKYDKKYVDLYIAGYVSCKQCLNCEKRSGGTLETRRRRRRDERRRRENRGAEGAEGVRNGCPPPQPTIGSGRAS